MPDRTKLRLSSVFYRSRLLPSDCSCQADPWIDGIVLFHRNNYSTGRFDWKEKAGSMPLSVRRQPIVRGGHIHRSSWWMSFQLCKTTRNKYNNSLFVCLARTLSHNHIETVITQVARVRLSFHVWLMKVVIKDARPSSNPVVVHSLRRVSDYWSVWRSNFSHG